MSPASRSAVACCERELISGREAANRAVCQIRASRFGQAVARHREQQGANRQPLLPALRRPKAQGQAGLFDLLVAKPHRAQRLAVRSLRGIR